MPTQEELMKQIADNDEDLKDARRQLSFYREKFLNMESLVISHKLKKERLEEELQALQNRTVKYEMSDEEEVDERFRQLLPELLKKVK